MISVVALWLAACGTSGPGSTDDPDSGVAAGQDAATPTVEIGTGVDAFESIVEDQVLELRVGPQGGGRFEGYHIFSAVKVDGYDPVNLLATFQILSEDRQVQAEQARQFPRLQPDGEAYVAFAVAPRLMDCCVVEDATIYLRVEVRDQNGLTGSDERRVHTSALCEDQEQPGTSVCE